MVEIKNQAISDESLCTQTTLFLTLQSLFQVNQKVKRELAQHFEEFAVWLIETGKKGIKDVLEDVQMAKDTRSGQDEELDLPFEFSEK